MLVDFGFTRYIIFSYFEENYCEEICEELKYIFENIYNCGLVELNCKKEFNIKNQNIFQCIHYLEKVLESSYKLISWTGYLKLYNTDSDLIIKDCCYRLKNILILLNKCE